MHRTGLCISTAVTRPATTSAPRPADGSRWAHIYADVHSADDVTHSPQECQQYDYATGAKFAAAAKTLDRSKRVVTANSKADIEGQCKTVPPSSNP